ncbi:MAG: hypothetical protein JNJ94_07560 [Chlorobi bacterium]|nr:hypothetical protein [Chlorobiota bacterium]
MIKIGQQNGAAATIKQGETGEECVGDIECHTKHPLGPQRLAIDVFRKLRSPKNTQRPLRSARAELQRALSSTNIVAVLLNP